MVNMKSTQAKAGDPGIYSISDLFRCDPSRQNVDSFQLSNQLFVADRVHLDVKLFEYPHRIDGVALMLCHKGYLTGTVNLSENRLEEGMVAVLHRDHLLLFRSQSDDFEASVIVLSSQLIQEFHIDLTETIPLFMYMKDHPLVKMNEEESNVLHKMYGALRSELIATEEQYRVVIVQRLLEAFLYKILSVYRRHAPEMNVHRGRREEFFVQFMSLLTKYHKQERSMGFYADQLHITPKYLSSVIKEVSGRSAAEWIDRYVILEAKALLRYSGLSIQEIAYELNFSTQSFFGKYFKHHTGMSPSEYKSK